MARPYKMTDAEKGRGGGLFRLLVGEHLGPGPAGCECSGCRPDATGVTGKNHRYRARRHVDRYGEPPPGSEEEKLWPKDGQGNSTCLHRKGRGGVQGVRCGRDIVYADPPDYDNDVIESAVDLELFNSTGAREYVKFIRIDRNGQPIMSGDPYASAASAIDGYPAATPVPAAPPTPPAAFPLEKMSIAQLLAVAEEEEVEVRGEAKKDKLIALIRTALPEKYGGAREVKPTTVAQVGK